VLKLHRALLISVPRFWFWRPSGATRAAWEDLAAHIAYRIAAAAAVSGPHGQLAELCQIAFFLFESARGNASDLHVKLTATRCSRVFSVALTFPQGLSRVIIIF